MTLASWRILTAVFLGVAVLIVLFLLLAHLLKNKYGYNCRDDKQIKNEKFKGFHYEVFEVLGRSAFYIDKYVIKHRGKNAELICDYVNNYNYISYYILLFTKKGKLMKIMEVSENDTATCSKPIKLPKKCYKVNIVVNNVNGEDLGVKLKAEVSLAKIKTFAIFESIALFLFLFTLRHALIEVLCFNSQLLFLLSDYNTISIVIIGLFAIINFMIVLPNLKRTFGYKKKKEKKARRKNRWVHFNTKKPIVLINDEKN